MRETWALRKHPSCSTTTKTHNTHVRERQEACMPHSFFRYHKETSGCVSCNSPMPLAQLIIPIRKPCTETMRRSRSISPSTSIRSHNSDSDESDISRYAGMTEEQLNEIWERRNLAYFDRRQRKLAEERERQQQQGVDGDGSATHGSGGSNSSGHLSAHEAELPASSSSSSQSGQQQQLTQPAGFLCAADSPAWREFTSSNAMGDFDAERASRDPAYLHAWTSCERLVNMNRSGATTGNFIPTNPRLAALLEQQRLEVARERYQVEAMRRQQQQQQSQVGADQHLNMMAGGSASQEPSTFASSVAAQQAAEYERLNQAHRQEQERESYAYAKRSNSPKSSSSGSSGGEKSVQTLTPSYYMALPNPTPQLTKSVICSNCNLGLYTAVPADQFFCQTCGAISSVPPQGAEATYEEKMYDADDHDCQKMSYY